MEFKKNYDIVEGTQKTTDGEFAIYIEKDMIEITFDWDHGYGGRGIGRMYIPLSEFKAAIDLYHGKEMQK